MTCLSGLRSSGMLLLHCEGLESPRILASHWGGNVLFVFV